MSWSARTGSRGGRKRSSLACTTSSKIARHTERRTRPAFHRQPIDAQNVGGAQTEEHSAPASLGAKKQQPHGSIELAELYRTVEVREAMAGRRGFVYDRKRRLRKSDTNSQILTSPGWTQTPSLERLCVDIS